MLITPISVAGYGSYKVPRDGQSEANVQCQDDPDEIIDWSTTHGTMMNQSTVTDGGGHSLNAVRADNNLNNDVMPTVTATKRSTGESATTKVEFYEGFDPDRPPIGTGGLLRLIPAAYSLQPSNGQAIIGPDVTVITAHEAWIEAAIGDYRAGDFVIRRRFRIIRVSTGSTTAAGEDEIQTVSFPAGSNSGPLPLIVAHVPYGVRNWGTIRLAPGTYTLQSETEIEDAGGGAKFFRGGGRNTFVVF